MTRCKGVGSLVRGCMGVSWCFWPSIHVVDQSFSTMVETNFVFFEIFGQKEMEVTKCALKRGGGMISFWLSLELAREGGCPLLPKVRERGRTHVMPSWGPLGLDFGPPHVWGKPLFTWLSPCFPYLPSCMAIHPFKDCFMCSSWR